MALQVWLPLNGKIENCGVAGDGVTVTGTPSYVNGITGKALNAGGVQMSAAMTGCVLNNTSFTYCCWFYVNAETGSNNATMIFGNQSMTENDNRKFSIFQYPTCNDLHLSWMNDVASTTYISTVLYGVLPSKKWTHVAVVYDNPTVKIYINGKVQWTGSGVSNSSTFAYKTNLIYNSVYHYMSDVRVYDNALSPKEVHEIAQGLCCHYPLNDPTPTASINKYSGDVFSGKAVSYTDVFTMSELTDERGYKFTLNYTGTGKDYWANIQYPVVNFTAGKTYDYSCKVRANNGNFDLRLRAARISNDWEAAAKNVMNRDGQWHEYHIRITLEAKSVRSGTEYDTKPLVEFYTQDLKEEGTVYKCDIDIKDIQISECNTDASISNGAWNDLTVYDTSGFGNNGNVTVATVPMLAGDSARYDKCYEFDGANDYITVKNPLNSDMTEFSISCWANISYGTTQTLYTARTEVGKGIALFVYNGSFRLDDNTQTPFTYNMTGYANNWTHICLTRNATQKKLYINGALVATAASTSDMGNIGVNGTIGGSESKDDGIATGNWLKGKLSDFRIYATALSDEDVAALYKTPISVTSSGAMIVKGEVIESI